ncbi:ferredoxin [Nocardia amikacinitolerans]|uniref:ferredoxin n=1 Tax=Nocardia amikacinitolerans TaxID=756689 RepID=UPI00082B5E4B|nr:ferredoxin [Nocardia amikacinitolerans]MCP2315966.1 ferredoxin [Nocardia amikacinitolerans]
MKITIDYDRCEGHGLCADQAPNVFSLDDDAELIYHFDGEEVPGDEVAAARAAIVSCPVAALRESS